MDFIEAGKAAVMGIVQGLTEFLPISSTGHLVVTARLIGFEDPGEVFTVVIQLGAILAVCWYYRRRLWDLLRRLPSDPLARGFAVSVIIACLPAAVIGLKANKFLEAHLFNPTVVAVTTAVGGLAIIIIERMKHRVCHAEAERLPWRTALGIGLCQLLALVPGVSRSGSTIMGALCLGVERKAATEFSFFLAIPVMFGASALKLVKHHNDITQDRLGIIAVGFVVSFIVALAVVHWLLRFVANHTFVVFGWYRIVVGLLLALAMVLGWIVSF
jgi:undecaprenyl-diphosphatase